MAKNRTELVAEVAEKSGKSQATVNAVLDAVFQVFESSVSKGEKITIPVDGNRAHRPCSSYRP